MKKGLILILTIGVFSIINTEMGVVGILPLISQNYGVTAATAGLLVSMFALVVAISGPTMPLFFSGVNRKKVMLLVLSVFTVCNVISAFASAFPVVLVTRVIPAFSSRCTYPWPCQWRAHRCRKRTRRRPCPGS